MAVGVMRRSSESLSHRLDGLAGALRPDRDARVARAVEQALTPDGRVRAEQLDGFVPPERLVLDALERGVLVEIDPFVTTAGTCNDVLVPVPGAEELDAVLLGPPPDFEFRQGFFGFVHAPGEVTIRICNYRSTTVDVPAGTWRVVLLR